MHTERARNGAVFLDDVDEFNEPWMFMPGNRRHGMLEAGHDTTRHDHEIPAWTFDAATITRLVERAGGRHGGLAMPCGPAGSKLVFSGCLVHAQGSNLSRNRRVGVYLSRHAKPCKRAA